MKLVSLNLWAGREFDPLMEYVSDRAMDTDIFCFQEVFHTPTSTKTVSEFYRANIFSELQKALPNHTGHFAPVQEGYGFDGPVDYPLSWGLAMLIKKSLAVNETGDIYLFGHHLSGKKEDNSSVPRNLQYVHLKDNGQDYSVAHFHGLWNGNGKTDTAKDFLINIANPHERG